MENQQTFDYLKMHCIERVRLYVLNYERKYSLMPKIFFLSFSIKNTTIFRTDFSSIFSFFSRLVKYIEFSTTSFRIFSLIYFFNFGRAKPPVLFLNCAKRFKDFLAETTTVGFLQAGRQREVGT